MDFGADQLLPVAIQLMQLAGTIKTLSGNEKKMVVLRATDLVVERNFPDKSDPALIQMMRSSRLFESNKTYRIPNK